MQPATRPPAVPTPTALELGLLVTGAVFGRLAAELTARYGGVFSPQTVTAVVADSYTRPRPRPGWPPPPTPKECSCPTYPRSCSSACTTLAGPRWPPPCWITPPAGGCTSAPPARPRLTR